MPQDSTLSSNLPHVTTTVVTKYLEMTKCSARWNDMDHTSIDLIAEGYIRDNFSAVRLTPRGWQNVQADNDDAPLPAFVIDVERVASTFPGNVPRGFLTIDNFPAPPQLNAPSNPAPAVVFCALEPGADLNTPAEAAGRTKKVRLKL
jgi:hypothetical protein